MKQTESRSIRQLWKDSPVMFILSLLVLLMDIQVIFACECQEADFLRAMCPAENKAVILGRLISESSINSTSNSVLHHVKLMKIIKEGSTKLTLFPEKTIKMISPEGCSLVYTGDWATIIIYGETDAGGVLHSSKCASKLINALSEVELTVQPDEYNPKC